MFNSAVGRFSPARARSFSVGTAHAGLRPSGAAASGPNAGGDVPTGATSSTTEPSGPAPVRAPTSSATPGAPQVANVTIAVDPPGLSRPPLTMGEKEIKARWELSGQPPSALDALPSMGIDGALRGNQSLRGDAQAQRGQHLSPSRYFRGEPVRHKEPQIEELLDQVGFNPTGRRLLGHILAANVRQPKDLNHDASAIAQHCNDLDSRMSVVEVRTAAHPQHFNMATPERPRAAPPGMELREWANQLEHVLAGLRRPGVLPLEEAVKDSKAVGPASCEDVFENTPSWKHGPPAKMGAEGAPEVAAEASANKPPARRKLEKASRCKIDAHEQDGHALFRPWCGHWSAARATMQARTSGACHGLYAHDKNG